MCGCGSGGVGYDPHAAHRYNLGRRMGRGTTVGVTKSAKRLEREAAGLELVKKESKKVVAVRKALEKNKELSSHIPESGVIKSKKRLDREKKRLASEGSN